ncbi:hypothetical protein J3R30DRAFT_3278392 [Lentinula aciculospora]|uniref:Uncharacterized protein n=1 Tax=Lentinula aciculospora TaxID=153920 RepID=A0A9W9AX27_9AGAR|nr:hypothetical protein J3R30DRAFT_3278392 [Lentinula aciculospora]
MSPQRTFPIDEAQLTSVITEGIFYGHVRTFVFKRRKDVHVHMIVAAICLSFFATLDLAAGIRLNLRVFLYLRGNTVDDFSDISYWVNVLKMVAFVGQVLTGDSILLYRCWVIYGRNYRVIAAPAIMLAAELICGCAEIYIESTFGTGMTLVVSKQFSPYIITVIVLTVCVNISVTCECRVALALIIWRIWSIINTTKKLFPSRTRSPSSDALCILVDSGLMYTSSALIMLITYVMQNNASYLVSDCLVQIIGITFNLIIIRVGRGTATQPLAELEKTRSDVSERHSIYFSNSASQREHFDASASFNSFDTERLREGTELRLDDDSGVLTPPPKTHSARIL